MSFNMSAMRASVGSIALRQPARPSQRPVSLALPSFSGLSISGRINAGEDCESSFLCLYRLRDGTFTCCSHGVYIFCSSF